MPQSVEEKVTRKLDREGRGWAFSPADLSPLGSRAAIDLTLHRLMRKGLIRRVLRGIYIYPRHSKLLDKELAPDIDQVARALARKFGWRIQPSGPVAQNIIGLSTQVPASFVYLSDGPARSYQVGNTTLTFEHTASKETNLKLRESSFIVQALKSLGPDRITPRTIAKIRKWLPPKLRARILADTKFVTAWVYAAIRQICREDDDG
jgi:Family of unknown function (DUF6088)